MRSVGKNLAGAISGQIEIRSRDVRCVIEERQESCMCSLCSGDVQTPVKIIHKHY